MGAMSATLHVVAVAAGGSVDELWDLAEELNARLGKGRGPGLHGFSSEERQRHADLPRFCFHPDTMPDVEFRHDDLREALVQGCMYLAQQLPPHDLWRRD